MHLVVKGLAHAILLRSPSKFWLGLSKQSTKCWGPAMTSCPGLRNVSISCCLYVQASFLCEGALALTQAHSCQV